MEVQETQNHPVFVILCNEPFVCEDLLWISIYSESWLQGGSFMMKNLNLSWSCDIDSDEYNEDMDSK
jgi:hypothetical protein